MKKLHRHILWALLLAAVVYAGFALWTGTEGLFRALGTASPLVFGGALILSLANYGLRWAKWHLYLGELELEIPRFESAVVFIGGFVMSITPGKVGEVLKSGMLRESRGIPVARTAPIVLAERLTDLIGLVVIAGFGVMLFDYGRVAFALVVAGIVGLIFFLQRETLVGFCLGIVERLPLGERIRPRLDEAYASTRALLRLRVMAVAVVLSVLGWGMEAFAFWWIVGDLGGAGTLPLLAFLFAMTTILGAISFLPGGLGVTEGSMIGALLLFGVFEGEGDAAAATYLIRAATLWFGVLCGIAALALFRWRFVPEPEPLPSDLDEAGP